MDPFKKFKSWFAIAKKNHPFDHTAFALSTVSKNQIPNVRMVLLKMILRDGFVFFTNLNSVKGKDFKNNNNLSMCFYWESIKKQIRITGKAYKIDDSLSDKYYYSRPRGSRIGAWVSNQSSEISDHSILKKREIFYNKKFENNIVPRPSYWAGIKICPKKFEFWQEKEFRLHKRELFELKKKVWIKKILSP
tara:strand:- start:977 stop:1549 length:573 start_codon:yes stop_codon:yes gene_type:complete